MSTVDLPSLDPCLHMQFSSFLPMPIEWLCVLLDPPAFQDLQAMMDILPDIEDALTRETTAKDQTSEEEEDDYEDYEELNARPYKASLNQLISGTLESCFWVMDNIILHDKCSFKITGGSTALMVFIMFNRVWVANCGDSRAVLYRENKNFKEEALSYDFTPESDRRRIQVKVLKCNEELGKNDVIVMATDGLWDVVSNKEAGDIIRKTVAEGGGEIVYTNIAKRLVERARGERKDGYWEKENGQLASGDDISVFVIPLNKFLSNPLS